MGSKSKNDKVKVALSRDVLKDIKKYYICPLCGKTMEEALSHMDCMHSFCKNCIYEKLKDKGPKKCPVCDYEIGPNLTKSLRQDNHWQDIIEIIKAKVKVARTPDQSGVGETSSQANSSNDRSIGGGRTLRPRKR